MLIITDSELMTSNEIDNERIILIKKIDLKIIFIIYFVIHLK